MIKASRRPLAAHDLVEVEWVDSAASGGWTHVEGTREVEKQIVSIGWIIAESKTSLTMAASLGLEAGIVDQTCDAITIPQVAIRMRRTLRKGRKR